MKGHFNVKRFLFLTKREEFMRLHTLIYSALAISASVAVLFFLPGNGVRRSEYMHVLFLGFLFVGGFLTAAGAFRNIHSRETCHDWLMLPASSLEKFISRLLVSSLGWWVYINLVFFIGVLGSEILRFFVIGDFGGVFNPFSPQLLRSINHYIILQSLFFAGGAWFRRHQFFKTILSLSVLGMSLLIIFMTSARIIFSSYFDDSFTFDMSIHLGDRFFANTLGSGELIIKILKAVYLWFIAPFCWVIAFMKVREAEVKNAL